MNIPNLWTLPNVKHKVKLIISLNLCSPWGSKSRLGILYLLCRRGRDLTHFVEARGTLYNVLPIWNSRCKIPTVFGKAAEGALQIHSRGVFLEWFAIGKSFTYLLTYGTWAVGFMIIKIINDSCKPGREKKSAYSGVQ